MKNFIVTIATQPTDFPAGTVAAGIVVSVSGPAAIPSQTLTAAPYVVTLGLADGSDLPAGDYTITAQQTDAAGQPLGSPVSTVETVTASTVLVDIPVSLSVKVV